jgi:hypothetical protein
MNKLEYSLATERERERGREREREREMSVLSSLNSKKREVNIIEM